MNVTTSAKRSNRFFVLCLALLAAVVMASAPQSAPAGNQVPFRADFATQFTSVVTFPISHISVLGQGKATHMGKTTAVSTNEEVNLLSGAATATFTFTAANGDTVILELVAQTTFLPNGVTFAGTYSITGGTGRFSGATGSGSISGSATFTSPNGGFGSFGVDGTISSPGGH